MHHVIKHIVDDQSANQLPRESIKEITFKDCRKPIFSPVELEMLVQALFQGDRDGLVVSVASHQDQPPLQFNLTVSKVLLIRDTATLATIKNNFNELAHESNCNELSNKHYEAYKYFFGVTLRRHLTVADNVDCGTYVITDR